MTPAGQESNKKLCLRGKTPCEAICSPLMFSEAVFRCFIRGEHISLTIEMQKGKDSDEKETDRDRNRRKRRNGA